MELLKRWLAEMREGVRVICSRDFWATFRSYWSRQEIAKRMDAWAARRTGD